MKQEITITAFEDHNGVIGWTIGTLENTFDSEIDACDGRLLAHDILEHNPKSNLTGITNELEAIGAAGYVRGLHLQLDSDLVFMAHGVAYGDGISVPRETLETEYDFDCFVKSAAVDIKHEIELHELDSEQRKNLTTYLRYAAQHMQAGYVWARQRYTDTNAWALSSEIEKLCPEPEFIGQQMTVNIDEVKMEVFFEEKYDDEFFED